MIPREYDYSDYDDYEEVPSYVPQSIYILVALENERVKECFAVTDLEKASKLEKTLRDIYGGANVALCSRELDKVPFLIEKKMLIDSIVEGVNSRIAKQKQGTPTTRDR